MSLRSCPNSSLGKALTCSLTSWPSTAGKPTASKGQSCAAPGSFQAWQLPPGAPLHMAGGQAMASLQRHRFPKEKGRFEPRRSQAHCCQAHSTHWILAGVYFLEDREQCEKVRKSHLSCSGTLKGFTSSHSSTTPSTGRLFHKPFSEKEIPATNLTAQNLLRDTQLTEPFAAVITHGQGFVSLIVLGSNSQATAVSFLKSHQCLQEFSNFSRIPMLLFGTILRLLTEKIVMLQIPSSGGNKDIYKGIRPHL